MENSRNKQFVTVTLCIILSHVITSCAAGCCCPGHESSLCLAVSSTGHLVAMLSWKTVKVLQCSCSVSQFSHSVMSDSLWPHGLQHTRLPCPSPTARACSNSCLLSWWCHPAISSSVIRFCLQSFPASGAFPISQFFASSGQSTGVSASAPVLPMNIQDWFPLGLISLISLQSKGLSRIFCNTTVQKHQFFSVQLLFIVQLSHPYMTTRKTIAFTRWTFVSKVICLLFIFYFFNLILFYF